MIVLGSSTAAAGMGAAIDIVTQGGHALDAVEAGLRLVEVTPDVRSVGQDAWPNLLGEHELDASIMDGRTRDAGAVAGLHGFVHPITVARRVMERLPHVFLVGRGAERFAAEVGAERGDLMTDEVRQAWADWVQQRASPDQWRNWPPDELAPWARLTVDPETAHGTVCLMVRDSFGDVASGVSTSGWAWKYPGRVGDSPIIGAGNYADNRYGAASCTGFGEMTIRAGTARAVLHYLRDGLSVDRAVQSALDDLHDMDWQYRGVVAVYALDCADRHCVRTYARSTEGRCMYQLWTEAMSAPQEYEGTVFPPEGHGQER